MDKPQVALVTGASRGIGRAILMGLVEQGYYVIGTATTTAGAERIQAELQAHGEDVGLGRVLDVCDDSSVTNVLDELKSTCGVPAVLVNNAGITDDNVFLRMRPEQWSRVIDTNLSSVYRMTKACLSAGGE